jgi:hypothetical protein
MNPIEAFWHLLNLFVPALGLGALAAAATKLLWRGQTRGLAWWRLAGPACAAAAVATVGGLLFYGQDGRMGTYAAMVLVAALTLWWRVFLRRR